MRERWRSVRTGEVQGRDGVVYIAGGVLERSGSGRNAVRETEGKKLMTSRRWPLGKKFNR
jgi:hypothetical protein